ncbi:apolipoprotein N-acyltransferase [Williamsia maris]|uniref:Apolipoprotein N-acyltransferase n=2 Tax=Williamsia maris TaxID=72806 RepID=A0ABT1HJW6_9NOCA|nr:apolipoprotein N-acyltransferase [Williamsia maris]
MSRLLSVRELTRSHVVARTVVSVLGGVAMWGSFPPRSLWFLGVVSLALLAGALGVGRPSLKVGAWCGLVYGLAFWLPLLPWIGVYVGPLPWVALSVALSIYLVLFGVIATATMRLPVAPLWFALSWVTVEWARSSFPFGGFPWGAAAFGQVNSPLISVAALGGVPTLSFAVALTGAALAGLVLLVITAVRAPRTHRPVVAIAGALALFLIAPICAAAMWPSVDAATDIGDRPGDSVTIAAIQGNVPRLGLEFNAQRRAVLDNHVRETFRLADEIRAGRQPRPDVVLWPENASDIDPLANSDASEEITAASRAVGAPILVGTLVENPDGRPTNTVLVWDGSNGPIGRYDKHIVQPFGEYLPWRSFFRKFSSYADQAGNFRAGTGSSVLQVPTAADGTVAVGVSTCWEVAFDRSARAAVRDGAQMIYVPTNNATFGRTEMTYQQLAMSQVRAVEHGRSVAVAATSGISAIVAPDGSLVSRTGFFEPGMLVERIPLHTAQTPATRVGAIPQVIAIIVTLIGFLVALALRIRFDRRLRDAPTTSENAPDERTQSKETDGIAET